MKNQLLEELHEAWRRSGMTGYDLEKASGYQRESIWGWFSGRNRPLLTSFIDLADTLGYDVVLVKRSDKKVA